jgi:hypothetical protein
VEGKGLAVWEVLMIKCGYFIKWIWWKAKVEGKAEGIWERDKRWKPPKE